MKLLCSVIVCLSLLLSLPHPLSSPSLSVNAAFTEKHYAPFSGENMVSKSESKGTQTVEEAGRTYAQREDATGGHAVNALISDSHSLTPGPVS